MPYAYAVCRDFFDLNILICSQSGRNSRKERRSARTARCITFSIVSVIIIGPGENELSGRAGFFGTGANEFADHTLISIAEGEESTNCASSAAAVDIGGTSVTVIFFGLVIRVRNEIQTRVQLGAVINTRRTSFPFHFGLICPGSDQISDSSEKASGLNTAISPRTFCIECAFLFLFKTVFSEILSRTGYKNIQISFAIMK